MPELNQQLIIDRCCDFKKIIFANKVLLAFQTLIDLCTAYFLFYALIESHYFLPYVIELVILLKVLVTLIIRDFKGNIAGIIISFIVVGLTVYFNLTDPIIVVLIGLSFVLNLLKIKNCYVVQKIKKLYGYPGFHGFFIYNEIKSDEAFFDIIKKQYNGVLEDRIVRYQIINLRSNNFLKAVKLIGCLILILGLCLFSSAFDKNNKISNATELNSLERCSDKIFVRGSVHKIYSQSGISLSAGADDCYWCDFCNECVTFAVPDSYKIKFAKLYNYYSNANALGMDEGYYEGYYEVKEKSSDRINFIGQIRYKEKYDYSDSIINEGAIDQTNENAKKVNKKIYIQVVNVDKIRIQMHMGIIFIIVGVFVTAINCFIIFNQSRYIINFR